MRRRPSLILAAVLIWLFAPTICFAQGLQQNKNAANKPDLAVAWDGKLTAEAEKLILQEIDALSKRVKSRLSPSVLKQLEERIDRQREGLRGWARNKAWRYEDSTGPFFSAFLRQQESGADIKKPPVMLKGPGIAGLTKGSKRAGEENRYEASFNWTESDGSFAKEWSEDEPVDEEYRVRVTGKLRLYLLVETTAKGKVFRAEGETKKFLFQRHPIVLKASEAEVRVPLNAGGQ